MKVEVSLRNSDLEIELEDVRAQLQDLDLLREQLDALKAPDVQMLGEPTTEEIVEIFYSFYSHCFRSLPLLLEWGPDSVLVTQV